MTGTSVPSPAQRHWEGFYQERDEVWSGNPNALLVREVASATPGTALDLGCGEGADAIWLARRGWQVTAVDIASTALRRAAARAAEAGVTDRVVWVCQDLVESFPGGLFDLVSAQFFHSPIADASERETIMRQAADAVAPGGVLLIVSHGGWPSWVEVPPFDHRFPTIPEILDALRLPVDRWRVEVAESVETESTGPDGQLGHRGDTVVRARRLS